MQSSYIFNTNTHIVKCKISYRMEKQLKSPAVTVTNNKSIFPNAMHGHFNKSHFRWDFCL